METSAVCPARIRRFNSDKVWSRISEEGDKVREDLQKAWLKAKNNRKADIYGRFPSPEDIEPGLNATERVLFLLKGNLHPRKIHNWGDIRGGAMMGTLVLTDQRIHYFGRGMVKSITNTHETVDFKHITGIELTKNMSFGQMIYVTRPSNCDTWANLNDDEAREFVRLAQHHIDETLLSKNKAAQSADIDPLDQLKKLKDLLDAGVLSKQEFDDLKTTLMGKI